MFILGRAGLWSDAEAAALQTVAGSLASSWGVVGSSVHVRGEKDVTELFVAQSVEEFFGEIESQRAAEVEQLMHEPLAVELADGR